MQDWHETPLTFSEILDVTFRIIKEHSSKLFLLMLIFMGPVYVLQMLAMIAGGVSLLPEPNRVTGIASLLQSLAQGSEQVGIAEPGIAYLLLFTAAFLLLAFFSLPMAYATTIILTDQIRKQEEIPLSAIVRRALSRFWPLLGGSIVYGLLMIALYFGMALIIIVYWSISVGLGMLGGLAAAPAAGLLTHVIVVVLLALGSFLAFVYLSIRWSFFFAASVFEKVSPGLGKSWRLTRGNFWRLIGVYLVITILNLIILMVLQSAVNLFLGGSILAFLLNGLVSMVIMIMPTIAYAVIYFDLRLRNEATDLKGMIESYNSSSGSANTAFGQNRVHLPSDVQVPGELNQQETENDRKG